MASPVTKHNHWLLKENIHVQPRRCIYGNKVDFLKFTWNLTKIKSFTVKWNITKTVLTGGYKTGTLTRNALINLYWRKSKSYVQCARQVLCANAV